MSCLIQNGLSSHSVYRAFDRRLAAPRRALKELWAKGQLGKISLIMKRVQNPPFFFFAVSQTELIFHSAIVQSAPPGFAESENM